MTVLEREIRDGFPRLAGAQVRATIPIPQEWVDSWLSGLGIRVEIHERNRITIHYRMFDVGAEIVRVTTDLTVVLKTSWVSRTALRAVLGWKPGLQMYLDQQDEFVYILCGRIPAVAKYRNIWQHLSGVQARTEPGRLLLDAEMRVRHGKEPSWRQNS